MATTTTSSPCPSVAAIAFRWLDILEKEFDKSYVGLDHQLAQILAFREENGDDGEGKQICGSCTTLKTVLFITQKSDEMNTFIFHDRTSFCI